MIINSIAGGGSSLDISALTATPADVLVGKKFIGSGSEEVQDGTLNLYNIVGLSQNDINDDYACIFGTADIYSELRLPVPKTITKIPNFISVIYTLPEGTGWSEFENLKVSSEKDDHIMLSLAMGVTDSSLEQYWYMVTGVNPMWESISNERNVVSAGRGTAYPTLNDYSSDEKNYIEINIGNIGKTSYGSMTLPQDVSNIQAAAYMYFF